MKLAMEVPDKDFEEMLDLFSNGSPNKLKLISVLRNLATRAHVLGLLQKVPVEIEGSEGVYIVIPVNREE